MKMSLDLFFSAFDISIQMAINLYSILFHNALVYFQSRGVVIKLQTAFVSRRDDANMAKSKNGGPITFSSRVSVKDITRIDFGVVKWESEKGTEDMFYKYQQQKTHSLTKKLN